MRIGPGLAITCFLAWSAWMGSPEAKGAETISHGRQVLLNRGLQIQSLVFYNPPGFTNPGRWLSANFTSINSLQVPQIDTLAALPESVQWGRWFQVGNEGSRDLRTWEYPYEHRLASIQYGDELPDLMTPSRLADMRATYDHWRAYWPNTLVHTNVGGLMSTSDLTTYMQTTQPDMLMFDHYTYDTRDMYRHMQRYRLAALAGNDGTGAEPIAYGKYLYLYRGSYTAPLSEESWVRLDQFSSWAFGYTFVNAYVYNDVNGFSDQAPMMFTSRGDSSPSAVFNYVAETNRQSRNLGPALVRLVSTDIRMIPNTYLPLPDGVAGFVEGRLFGDPAGNNGGNNYITSITPTDSQGGPASAVHADVLVGFFKPLPADKRDYPFVYNQPFMIVNGAQSGTAAASSHWYHLTFDLGGSNYDSLLRLSRETGNIEIVSLASEGGTRYSLDLNLPGGTGDLFAYWDSRSGIETKETWTGDVSYYGSYFNRVAPPFGQTFTVPDGMLASQFEFFVDKGSGTSSSMAVAIWDSSGNVKSVVSTNRSDPLWGGSTQGWVPGLSSGTTLPPGTYNAAIWSNNPDVNIDIYLFRSTTSAYSSGFAYRGYESGAPLGDNDDFMARVTLMVLSRVPGDANEDSKVDVSDLGILAANYGTHSGASWLQGDFNRDGRVDVSDLGILAANYGAGTGNTLDFIEDAKVLGPLGDGDKKTETSDTATSTFGCEVTGLPLMAGFFLAGLMGLTKYSLII